MPPPPYVQPAASPIRYIRNRRRPNFHKSYLSTLGKPAGFLRAPMRYRRPTATFLSGKYQKIGGIFHNRGYSANPPQQQQKKQNADEKSSLRWWHIPLTGGIVWAAFYKYQERSGFHRIGETDEKDEDGEPKRFIKPVGPWQLFIYGTLPLKGMSRLWGAFNDIQLPVWLRVPGFKLYSYVFGVNLEEVGEEDLRTYRNLGEFFYRELKPGARPIDDALMVSPADGKVLHLGVIYGRQVEQVKGMTYSLDALLGPHNGSSESSYTVDFDAEHDPSLRLERDKEFAVLNGIQYGLDDFIGSSAAPSDDVSTINAGDATSRSFESDNTKEEHARNIRKEIAKATLPDHEMFFCVIYLAPGDYHRFHSPTNWVVETRRHFTGELFSVAPYFQHRLSGLFTLNERVALLGRWRHGFYSMTPVGATNVGSIKIHFDKFLKTNTSLPPPFPSYPSSTSLPDEAKEQERAGKRKDKSLCYEATYANASKLLGGYPLEKGQQMGGFNLGSTVVLVFEAPKKFSFDVKPGQTVKVGEKLGNIKE
ncbi:phosphatidylserine decarboxylase-domain-containing protein [Dipodascopsis tothii]|uniref:phosphatidylserine decarboxylase-domain-containing protein n=1 Tax=Dipodascopsis tothii TaxID=44089 RepID=UPI0034CD9B1E